MLATILNSFKVAEIRKKLLFTAALLALYRLGSFIPVPGVSTEALKQLEETYAGSDILGFLNLFTGGGLSRIALFALGIMPYITASIILQLLTVVSPSLEKLSKEGEVGQARITQYTRYLTVGLAFAQSIGYVFLFRSFQASAGQPVNLADLEQRFESGASVDVAALKAAGLATRRDVPVKILGRGELTKPLTVHAHGFSKAARAAIEAAGGTCQVIE